MVGHRGGVAVSMAPLLRKVFLVDLVKGMAVTFRNQSEEQRVTEQYPLERPVIFERYRGQPRLNTNPDTGESLCIVCDLCALACPEKLIMVKGERNPATKRKEVVSWTYDLEPLHVLRTLRRGMLDAMRLSYRRTTRWRSTAAMAWCWTRRRWSAVPSR